VTAFRIREAVPRRSTGRDTQSDTHVHDAASNTSRLRRNAGTSSGFRAQRRTLHGRQRSARHFGRAWGSQTSSPGLAERAAEWVQRHTPPAYEKNDLSPRARWVATRPKAAVC